MSLLYRSDFLMLRMAFCSNIVIPADFSQVGCTDRSAMVKSVLCPYVGRTCCVYPNIYGTAVTAKCWDGIFLEVGVLAESQ